MPAGGARLGGLDSQLRFQNRFGFLRDSPSPAQAGRRLPSHPARTRTPENKDGAVSLPQTGHFLPAEGRDLKEQENYLGIETACRGPQVERGPRRTP